MKGIEESKQNTASYCVAADTMASVHCILQSEERDCWRVSFVVPTDSTSLLTFPTSINIQRQRPSLVIHSRIFYNLAHFFFSFFFLFHFIICFFNSHNTKPNQRLRTTTIHPRNLTDLSWKCQHYFTFILNRLILKLFMLNCRE